VVLVAGLVSADPLRIGTFDIDVTPPVGSRMAYDPVTKEWDLGLRARGVVVIQSGMPSAVLNYLWAVRYNNDPQEAASIVVISTIMSIPALPLFLLTIM
jgi:predicted permease